MQNIILFMIFNDLIETIMWNSDSKQHRQQRTGNTHLNAIKWRQIEKTGRHSGCGSPAVEYKKLPTLWSFFPSLASRSGQSIVTIVTARSSPSWNTSNTQLGLLSNINVNDYSKKL